MTLIPWGPFSWLVLAPWGKGKFGEDSCTRLLRMRESYRFEILYIRLATCLKYVYMHFLRVTCWWCWGTSLRHVFGILLRHWHMHETHIMCMLWDIFLVHVWGSFLGDVNACWRHFLMRLSHMFEVHALHVVVHQPSTRTYTIPCTLTVAHITHDMSQSFHTPCTITSMTCLNHLPHTYVKNFFNNVRTSPWHIPN